MDPELQNTEYYFKQNEQYALVIASHIVSSISLVSSIFVIIVHIILLFYRSNIVNRLSLRFIVLASVFDSVYSACQIATDHINSRSLSCRAIAYILISTDTMVCMCLAVVGLNLVVIFAIRVSNTLKLEIIYYLVVAISGVLVTVIPRLVGNKTGPSPDASSSTCWYHYYFEGRMNNHFNWLWYYGWLLFSMVFAVIVAAVSIVFVVKARGNFASILDMQTRRTDANICSTYITQKHKRTTSVFQKIAIRCICYPLVPLITKVWGISLEFAIVSNTHIPYPLFFLDRLFSGLQGFLVACIYFTDPAICMVFNETRDTIKHKYVYDYYTILFKPSTNINSSSIHPKLIRVAQSHMNQSPESVNHDTLVDNAKKTLLDDIGSEIDISLVVPGTHQNRVDPESNTFTASSAILRTVRGQCLPCSKRYTILTITCKDGKSFIPSNNIEARSRGSRIIPLKRINHSKPLVTPTTTQNEPGFPCNAKTLGCVECLIPFKFAHWARLIHWMMIFIFRVKPIEPRLDDEEARLDTEEICLKLNSDESDKSRSSKESDITKPSPFTEDTLQGCPRNGVPSESQTTNTTATEGPSNSSGGPSLKRSAKILFEEEENSNPSSQRPSSVNIATLQREWQYTDESGVQSDLTDDIGENSHASSIKILDSSTTSKGILKKVGRPAASVVWNILATPRSKSFSAAIPSKMNEEEELIELQKTSDTPSCDEDPSQNSVLYDNFKYNAALCPANALRSEPDTCENPPLFTNQLFPRPFSQYSKGKLAKRESSGQDSAWKDEWEASGSRYQYIMEGSSKVFGVSKMDCFGTRSSPTTIDVQENIEDEDDLLWDNEDVDETLGSKSKNEQNDTFF